jgi:hypothetical protein
MPRTQLSDLVAASEAEILANQRLGKEHASCLRSKPRTRKRKRHGRIMITKRASFACFFGGALVALCASLVLPCIEARGAIITFVTIDEPGVNDGNVWYAGGEMPLVGAIDVDFILGTDTLINSGLTNFVACADCRLNFVTGPRVASPLPALAFASGGGVWIEGTIPDAGISTPQIPLAGEITGPPSFPSSFAFDLIPGALVTAGAFAVFRDVKNAALADCFGLPGGDQPWAGVFGIGLAGLEDIQTGAFITEVYGGGGP